jgi:endonuclease YncB( thermonuclease family)
MIAILALFGALALFWLSTRQFALVWRALIWLAGAALLAAAAMLGDEAQEFGLWQAALDAWAHRGNLREAAVVQTFTRNAGTVARFIPQLLDFFIAAGVALGVISLVAFSRGERIERALRPSILAFFAFVVGCTATLAIVAVGLGGQIKPRTFLGYVPLTAFTGEPSVHDGDTFWLGEVSLRLWGVDAPELNQACRGVDDCGEESRRQLETLVVGAFVQCDQKQSLNTGRWTESFGRPLVVCRVRRGPEQFDVGERMIATGFATQYRNDPAYNYSAAAEAGRGRGVMRGCSILPHLWRRDPSSRRAFEDGAIPNPDQSMGTCPTAVAQP